MAQSFKCDQGRAQENRSPLNIEQHCLSGVVSWMVLISLIHDTWRSKKVIECRGTAQKALFLHLKVSAQFPQPCPTLLGKSADERLELPWWSSQFSGPVLIHFSFVTTCFRCACSFLLLRNYQQLTKVCWLPLMTSFVPIIVVHPSNHSVVISVVPRFFFLPVCHLKHVLWDFSDAHDKRLHTQRQSYLTESCEEKYLEPNGWGSEKTEIS